MRRYLTTLDKLLHRRLLRRWSNIARNAATMDIAELRRARNAARQLRARIDELANKADGRLALPMVGNDIVQAPPNSEWSWRPPLFRGPLARQGLTAVPTKTAMADGITLFHDCRESELTLRQLRNIRPEDLAPYGLRMDVFRFDGTFLSLVVDIPKEGAQGLLKRHLVRLSAIIEVEKPLEIFARLNVRHGPNTEQVVRELPLHMDEIVVEFDLAYTKLNEKRIEGMWLDLIFESPQMNQVTIRDLTFSRYPRADI